MNSTVAVRAFAEGVTQQIKDYLPEDYQNMQCEVSEQQKNNGVVMTGIVLNMPGQKIAPVVYMEPFYDQIGLSSESIGDKCAGRFRTDGDGCAPFGGCGRKTGGGNVYKPIRHIARSTRFQPAQDW